MTTADEPRRFIPSVDKLLGAPELAHAVASYPRWAVLQEVRAVIEEVRNGTIPIVTDAALRAPWLASLALPAALRQLLARLVDATASVDRDGVEPAFRAVVEACTPPLDAMAIAELHEVMRALAVPTV